MGFWGFLCPCRWTEHSHLSRLVLIEGGDQGESRAGVLAGKKKSCRLRWAYKRLFSVPDQTAVREKAKTVVR